MTEAIEKNIPKMRIEESATKVQARIDSSEKTVVGVNKFTLSDNEEEKIDIKKVDNSQVLANQIERLKKLKSERNNNEVKEKLEKIRTGIKQNKNVLELAVNAARVGATVGEISNAMEEVWDRHKADVTLVKNTYANNEGSKWMLLTSAWGFAVFFGVIVAGQFSGAHLNPAVTLGMAVK